MGAGFKHRWGRNGEFCVSPVGPATRTAGSLYPSLIVSIAGSKVKRGELPRDGRHGQCVKLLLTVAAVAIFCETVVDMHSYSFTQLFELLNLFLGLAASEPPALQFALAEVDFPLPVMFHVNYVKSLPLEIHLLLIDAF